VQVVAGLPAGKQPWAVGRGGCAQVRPVRDVLSEQGGERRGNGNRTAAEPQRTWPPVSMMSVVRSVTMRTNGWA
jgi:hypothetical protein